MQKTRALTNKALLRETGLYIISDLRLIATTIIVATTYCDTDAKNCNVFFSSFLYLTMQCITPPGLQKQRSVLNINTKSTFNNSESGFRFSKLANFFLVNLRCCLRRTSENINPYFMCWHLLYIFLSSPFAQRTDDKTENLFTVPVAMLFYRSVIPLSH